MAKTLHKNERNFVTKFSFGPFQPLIIAILKMALTSSGCSMENLNYDQNVGRKIRFRPILGFDFIIKIISVHFNDFTLFSGDAQQ